MAVQEHLELSSYIKSIHLSLRNKTKQIGYNKAWDEHCQDESNLKKYAASMKELATKYWDNNEKINSKVISRIHWVYTYCEEYFHGKELEKQRLKEQDIIDKLGITDIHLTNIFNGKLELLDVGSCYNPFEIYKCYNVLAIDIAPACNNVYKCDFINVDIGNSNIFNNNVIKQLNKNGFHVIVFSLLLEYLPSPEQRLLCCQKAYNLLQNEGILIIITPDSKHVGANAKYMKSWRYVLSMMGFSRIKYEKLPYLHCMAFRKSINSEVPKRWATLNGNKGLFHSLYIPQDFQDTVSLNVTKEDLNLNINNDSDCNYFEELPFCV